MMAGFDLGGDVFSDNERSIRRSLTKLMLCICSPLPVKLLLQTSFERSAPLWSRTQASSVKAELSLYGSLSADTNAKTKRRAGRTSRGRRARIRRALERNLSDADINEVSIKTLLMRTPTRQDMQVSLVEELKADLCTEISPKSRNSKAVNEDPSTEVKIGAYRNGSAGGMANGRRSSTDC